MARSPRVSPLTAAMRVASLDGCGLHDALGWGVAGEQGKERVVWWGR